MKPATIIKFIGGVWPVVQRELREGARKPLNFWLRIGSAAAGTGLLFALTRNANEPDAALGIRLFTDLHTLLLGLIGAIVPLMTADCVAREKREGTLGLLLLTPLTAGGIVVGKGLVQALRAFTLWLAVLPVLVVPFVTGAVGWNDVMSAVTMEFCVAVLCLAAGMVASAIAKTRGAAFVLALTFSLGLVILFSQALAFCYDTQTRRLLATAAAPITRGFGGSFGSSGRGGTFVLGPAGPSPAWGGFFGSSGGFGSPGGGGTIVLGSAGPTGLISMEAGWLAGGPLLTGIPAGASRAAFGQVLVRTTFQRGGLVLGNGIYVPVYPGMAGPFFAAGGSNLSPGAVRGWSRYFGPTRSGRVWPLLCLESAILTPVFSLLLLVFAARCVKKSWQDRIPSPRRDIWLKRFCTPLSVIQGWFARRLQRSLDRNPIAWLQQYSWKARTTKWGVCLAVMAFECVAIADWWNFSQNEQVLTVGAALLFTFTGVGSFLSEKRSGALELILVTPLRVNQIIVGRVWGLWKQMLPAALVILSCHIAAASFRGSWPYPRASMLALLLEALPVISSFLVLPILATCFALLVRNLIVAAMLTWATLIVSWELGRVVLGAVGVPSSYGEPYGLLALWVGLTAMAIPIYNLVFAWLACVLLRRSLSRRIYAF